MILRKVSRREQADIDPSLKIYTPKLQQILASRGVQNHEELDYGLSGLLSPNGLKNIEQAANHVFDAVKANQSILVIGDFDADGATSSAVMLKSLKMLGAQKINFLVPDRFKFGYGLSVKLVEYAHQLSPDLIITVDNGIANVEGVERANQLGIPVIVTDHHLAADKLPEALSIVNPNQPGDNFASKNLAGVGVAFYLMLVLRSIMRTSGWFQQQQIEEPNLATLLDIVALGTVADVVVLDRNNRILVEQGLKRIRSGLACPGIQAILQVANRDYTQCQASDLGFAIGPRLNAAGRLDDMSIGIECLLADSLAKALPIASQLDQLNRSRKMIEKEMLDQASVDLESYLKKHELNTNSEVRPVAMCLFDPEWHQGVIGILASRIKEKINRPVIVFARDNDSADALIKGSARSVKGVHIRDALALVNARNPGLIEKFGGHAMAAGLSLKQKDFQVFAEQLHECIKFLLAGEIIKDEVLTDAGLTVSEMNLEFASLLRSLGPWGQGFPEPIFDDEFEVVQSRILGGEHLKLQVIKDGLSVDAIYFRCPENSMAVVGDRIHLVYKLDINEFRGNVSVQLMVEQLEIL
ncbi:single-stranded-DNA-specific exonuclease RecJ [Aliikangiella sp. IMCC44359]|uniref:single-stranded-DNA-specific exonuclease RecJ n=1 Tax=Aliikangiella sp. IMCC44359 TaxID=3459125 RepID=UPI00403B239E